VLHELGHALTARRFGIATRDITLYPIGGVARLERMTENPWQEFWIAVAGPAVNVAIAAALGLGVGLTASGASHPLTEFLLVLLGANVVLVVFNLLPAFPMDGGRVFRAFLTPFVGHLRATEIAAGVGAAIALVLGTLGLMEMLRVIDWPFVSGMLALVAFFVYLAGQQELMAVRQRDYLRRTAPPEVLPVDSDIPTVVPVDVEPSFTGLVWDDRNQTWVVWRNGRPAHSPWPY
jgi:Zn-dependent protease